MFERLLGERRIRVMEGPLPDGWWGAYDLDFNTIILRPRLAPLQKRSTLAHECAHAVLGHHGHHARQERAAEELAASWLISHRDFHMAARIHGTVQAVAHELDVLPRDVKAYARAISRARKKA